MSKKETVKRYILFIISLFFAALGVALTKSAELGVSPISSVANVMSLKFTAVSMGNWLIIWNCLLIVGQIIILKKDFKPIQLLQLPLSFIFGNFIDLCMRLVSSATVNSYPMRIVSAVIGLLYVICWKLKSRRGKMIDIQFSEDQTSICPQCGSHNIALGRKGYNWKEGYRNSVLDIKGGFYLAGMDSRRVTAHCRNCGHSWLTNREWLE